MCHRHYAPALKDYSTVYSAVGNKTKGCLYWAKFGYSKTCLSFHSYTWYIESLNYKNLGEITLPGCVDTKCFYSTT